MHCVKSVSIRSYSCSFCPTFELNTERYGVSLRIQSECGKMRTRIILSTGSFHAVLNMIIVMVMKIVVTRMAVSGIDFVHHCLDRRYHSFLSLFVYLLLYCNIWGWNSYILHTIYLILIPYLTDIGSTFTFKTDKYLNTISKQSINANFKLLFQGLEVIFAKLKALLISVKLMILLMLLMLKMMLIEGVMMNVKMMLMSFIDG